MHEKKTTVLTRAIISASFLFAPSLFHGSLGGVLNVLRSVVAFEEGFYLIQCYRVKIVSFNAAVVVPSVYFAIVNNLVTM